jgi:hypothetical protein
MGDDIPYAPKGSNFPSTGSRPGILHHRGRLARFPAFSKER